MESNASIKTALEPVKLFERIGKRDGDLGSRLTVQTICLDRRAPADALRKERLRFRTVCE
jgi:hypothetical protein